MTAKQLATIADDAEAQTPLPEGWRLVRLGDVCQFIYGSSLTTSLRQKGEVPVFGSNGIVGFHNEAITTGETIIIGRKGSVGEVNFSNVPCFPIDTTYFIDESSTNLDLKFLYNLLQRINLRGLNKSTAIPGLNREDAYALEIPLPPTIEEQRRIATILDEQMKAVEQARHAVEEQLEAAKLLPSAFLRSVFESEDQQNWPKRKLGEFLNLRKDVIHPRNNPKGKALFVGLEHIGSATGKRVGAIEVEKEKLTGRKPQFYKDDIVYGYLRPYLNKLWIADFDGLCSVDQYVYSVNTGEADLHYLLMLRKAEALDKLDG